MKKKHSKIIIFVAIFLIIASILILIDNLNSRKEIEVSSRYYASFVSSVQTLDRVLAQTNETEFNVDIVQLIDEYENIIFVNDRLALLKEKTNRFPSDLGVLLNDFMIFRNSYGSFLRQQIVRDNINSEVHLKVVNQIKLFLNDLPKEYEDSKEFYTQLSAAAEHIKPLQYINFE